MQTIFAYHTARQAEYNICRQEAQNTFLPDMQTMEEQDKDALAVDRETTGNTFDSYHKNGVDNLPEDLKPEILKAVKVGYIEYQNRLKDNEKQFKKRMLTGVTSIFDDYIKFVFLIVEFQSIIDREKRKKRIEHNNFDKNIVINKIKNFETFESERVRKDISWDTDLVKAWYREYIKTEEFFNNYDDLPKTDLVDDLDIVQTIYKSIIFKNTNINDYFEALDLGWEENKIILKSMVLKTIKSIETEESDPLLMELSKNWEEDLLFLKELYDLTIENENEYENLIKNKSKNWDIERVALTDRIILEMAIAEMTNFTSIPIKVTINEYIELSKLYSTPKSKQFVNGLLDVLSTELKKDGQIKKSGRGLLDNK